MKIVFMGTPDFAVPTLQKLIDEGHKVAAVFTQPDKPKGRGYKLTPPPVKELALKYNLPVHQPTKMRDGTALNLIKEYSPDLIVVVAYGRILPKDILEFPKYGCINGHASILPKYRGAGPIQWAVINGEKESGVTAMQMSEGLDTGDMLHTITTPIGENETYGELHDRLAPICAEVISETIKMIENDSLKPVKQEDSLSCYAPMLDKKLAEIDFTKSAKELHHLICGLSPWPVAYTHFNGKLLKIHRAVLAKGNGKPGELLDNKNMIVACGEGALEFTEVQLEGAKKMSAKDFIIGRHPEKGIILGE